MTWNGWTDDRTPGWIVRAVRARLFCQWEMGDGTVCGVRVNAGEGAVDHIVNRAEGGSLRDLDNFQLLCDTHHDQKTRAEHQRGQARRASRGRFDPGGHPAYL
ncbi:HNH endonuclease [Gordonia phage Margaret]|nr:HNH endonuclease [Gordonia phage Margaret]